MEIKEILTVENELVGMNIPCITILLPTHKASAERKVDRPNVERLINNVNQILKSNYPDFFVEISDKLNKIYHEIDFIRSDLGIGIFVSPYFSKCIRFNFSVKEKVYVGESFRLRELIYNQKVNPEYYYLSITSDKIRFFDGNGPQLIEVKNDFFPRLIIDEYIYERPSRGSSYVNSLKSTEKDKSIMQEKRLISELKKVDTIIKNHLKNKPLFISGVKKETGYFLKVSKNKNNLAGIIDGNYTKGNNKIPNEKIYDEVLAWQNMKDDEMLDELSDLFGKRQVASGLEEVWYAAKNGMGLTLFLEQDYECQAYVSDKTGILSRTKPSESYTEISDAVDYIIALVLSKNGNVHIVGNNKLGEHDRIALRLRYRRSEN